MKKNVLVILFVSVFFSKCEKETENFIHDNNYPTTIYSVENEELTRIRDSYFTRNPFLSTGLSNFGFCDNSYREVNKPPLSGSINSEIASEIFRNFIQSNRLETGINSFDNIIIDKVSEHTTNQQISSHWYISTNNQRIDTLEVLNTRMGVRIINGQVVDCSGNQYPEIYIPTKFNFHVDDTKHTLLNKTVKHFDGIHEYKCTIEQENLDKSSSRLVVVPVEIENKIEIRVCWEINIPEPIFFKYYIDVMDAKIIQELPTIIIN